MGLPSQFIPRRDRSFANSVARLSASRVLSARRPVATMTLHRIHAPIRVVTESRYFSKDVSPNGAQCDSPGQSVAPPWVSEGMEGQAPKGRNRRRALPII